MSSNALACAAAEADQSFRAATTSERNPTHGVLSSLFGGIADAFKGDVRVVSKEAEAKARRIAEPCQGARQELLKPSLSTQGPNMTAPILMAICGLRAQVFMMLERVTLHRKARGARESQKPASLSNGDLK